MTADPFSTAAAATIDKARLRATVLAYIESRGETGATSDECEAALSMSHQTVSARMVELKAAGSLRAAGRRPTRSGRTAGVWVVVPVQQTLWAAS